MLWVQSQITVKFMTTRDSTKANLNLVFVEQEQVPKSFNTLQAKPVLYLTASLHFHCLWIVKSWSWKIWIWITTGRAWFKHLRLHCYSCPVRKTKDEDAVRSCPGHLWLRCVKSHTRETRSQLRREPICKPGSISHLVSDNVAIMIH